MPTVALKYLNKQLNESTKNQSHNTNIPADLTRSSARPCKAWAKDWAEQRGYTSWCGDAGCTVCSPGSTQETSPKILIPHGWRPLRNTKEIPLAQSQGNMGLEVPARARRGFSFPVGLRRNAGEVKASNPSPSKWGWAPPSEAGMDTMEGDAKCILCSEKPCAQVTNDAPGSLLGCVGYTPHLTVLGLRPRLRRMGFSHTWKRWDITEL